MNSTWISPLIEGVVSQLSDDEYWQSRIGFRQDSSRAYHLAVFTQPLFRFVLEGKKTVESRFSITQCAPYSRIKKGDVVFVKESGGPVQAVAEVASVSFYRLDKGEVEVIKNRFGRSLCVDDDFWHAKAGCAYATLMYFSNLRTIKPVLCQKRDRRGWVVLRNIGTKPELQNCVDATVEFKLRGRQSPANLRFQF
jgi:hypothetical protein